HHDLRPVGRMIVIHRPARRDSLDTLPEPSNIAAGVAPNLRDVRDRHQHVKGKPACTFRYRYGRFFSSGRRSCPLLSVFMTRP
ncbi:MAG: hypothetical protein N6V49_02585, partial [Serratia symbiotica]|nr:hypothetical protein [Serratia symbiotica]